jgi:hypothetical protein
MFRKEEQWKEEDKRAKLSTLIATSRTTITYLDSTTTTRVALLKEMMVEVVNSIWACSISIYIYIHIA